MKKNEFISYKINNYDSSRNAENLMDLMSISPLKSYEIRLAKIPLIKNFNEKNINISIKLKKSNENKNLLVKFNQIKNQNRNLSVIRTPKKRINILFYNDIKNQKKLNDNSKKLYNKILKNNIINNKRSLVKKLKKFHSCQNLILGKYPINHRLLLPIQRDFKIDNHNILEEPKNDINDNNNNKNKNKREIFILDGNIEGKNLKEKGVQIKVKERNKMRQRSLIINHDKKGFKKKEKEKEDIKNEKEDISEKEEDKTDAIKDKIEIIFKIKKNKKNNKIERCITSTKLNILDKVSRIHEYNEKIKKMNSLKFKKKIDIIKFKELKEKEKERNSDIININLSKNQEIIDNNNTAINRNPKNKLDKSEFKSNSVSNIFENITQKNINIKPKQLNPIRNINNKKVEIKIINDNKEENINIQTKETQSDNNEINSKEESQKEKPKTKRSSYLTRDEFLERLVKTRKEYLEKEKNQSVQNITELYYLIFPGNASYLIKNCMNHRCNWKEPFSNVTSFYNFKWTELSSSLDYSSLGVFFNSKQVVNHFENHTIISNKANMFFNLMNYCEKNKISVFKYVPFTIVYRIKDRSKYSEDIKEIKRKKNLENLKKFIENTDIYIQRYEEIGKYFNKEKSKEISIKKENDEKIKKCLEMDDFFVVEKNEENSCYYTEIFQNVDKYIKEIKKDKNGKNEKIEEIKKIGMDTMIEIPLTHFTYRNLWVIKAINLNRGMCIKIVNNFTEMETIIEKFRQGVNYNFTEQGINEEEDKKQNENNNEEENTYFCDNIIIQKYIENPLLYKGRKFDMRIWVLLTHQMKVYIFKEGHLKTCSVKYDINSKDSFSHITNYSFQKNNNNFEKYEIGNEVPFYEFQKYLDEKYPKKNYKIKIDLMKQLKEIIALTMQSAKDKIKNNKNYQFEIFGYDFMLDEDFNVFLIEINTNPGLEESSPWIKIIVPRMLDDALRLTLDQIFETKYDFNLNYKNEEAIKNYKIVMHKLKNKENPNSINNLNENEFISKNENEKEKENNLSDDNKIKNDKKKKYISPFPVPGYELDDNLWELVCDLNENELKETKSETETYTGIKHLLKKKNEKSTTEK